MTRSEFLRLMGTLGVAQATGMGTWACEPQPDKKDLRGKQQRVLVIGAGIAGITAARDLKAAGYDVVVLEARPRVGGRIWTDCSLGTPIDMGASWIHGSKSNPLSQLIKQYNIKTIPSDIGSLYLYNQFFNLMSDTALRQKREQSYWYFRRAYKLAYRQNRDTPVTEALERLIKDKAPEPDNEQFLRWRLLMSALSEGTSLANLSTWNDASKRFGGQQLLLPQGYGQLIEKLVQGITILPGETVKHIRQSSKKITVETQNNKYEGDFAVLTVPLGVLKKGNIKFTPNLPAFKQKAIDELGMGLLNKIVLKFDEVFWKHDRHFFSHLAYRQHPYIMFVNWAYFSKQPVLIATTNQPAGKEADIKKEVLATLQKMFGKTAALRGFKQTTWSTDPFSYGAYSHLPVGVKATRFDALASPFERLYFAGEATHRHYLATVHGALLSGKRAAREIIKR